MNAAELFNLAGAIMLPLWLLLGLSLFLERLRTPVQLLTTRGVPAVLGVGYAVFLGLGMAGDVEGGFGSLAAVRSLFADDWLLLAGWVHYLVFDFFVGGWIARDRERAAVPRLVVLPCLAATFMAGPAGLLAYLLARLITRRLRSEPAAA